MKRFPISYPVATSEAGILVLVLFRLATSAYLSNPDQRTRVQPVFSPDLLS